MTSDDWSDSLIKSIHNFKENQKYKIEINSTSERAEGCKLVIMKSSVVSLLRKLQVLQIQILTVWKYFSSEIFTNTHSLVRALRWYSLWVSMAVIWLTSRYSSEVSAGIPWHYQTLCKWFDRSDLIQIKKNFVLRHPNIILVSPWEFPEAWRDCTITILYCTAYCTCLTLGISSSLACLYHTVLYCIILYCTAFHSTAHCTILCCTVLYCTGLTLGISCSLAWLHLTMVPVQVHWGGQ